jgi:hypothetical protein
MCVCMYVGKYVCICMYICIYIHIYVCAETLCAARKCARSINVRTCVCCACMRVCRLGDGYAK